MTREPALQLEQVTKRFGPVTALEDVSFAAHAGRVHALLGENGAGKSTLLGILAGSLPPSSGRLLLAGDPVDLASYDPQDGFDHGIVVVHQELALVPSLTVVENVFLGRELRRRGGGLDRRAMRRRASEALTELDAHIDVDTPVEALSIAAAQLVEIARALVFDSRIVALDEPSAVLAGHELEALFGVVRRLRDRDTTVIYVSHRLDEVAAICDDYTVLKDGRVAGTGPVAGTSRDELIRLMVGRDVSDTFPPRADQAGDVVLRVSGLTVPGLITDIGLEARAGEILGLAGLIGSGRTTLAKTVFGAIRPASGSIEVGGTHGPFTDPREALHAGIAYLPEDRKVEGLALDKTVRWNLSLLVIERLRGRSGLIDERDERDTVRERLASLDVRTHPEGTDLAGQLSGGNQQKVVVGKWLLADPTVLILDEPTRGIDVGAKEQIYALLRELADEGRCVIVISSELIEIIGLCDRVLVLREGRIAGELTGGEATEEAIMRLATPVSDRAEEGAA